MINLDKYFGWIASVFLAAIFIVFCISLHGTGAGIKPRLQALEQRDRSLLILLNVHVHERSMNNKAVWK